MNKKQILKLFRGVQVVECDNIELTNKDIIVLKEWKDFTYIAGTYSPIYKLKNTYYFLSPDVAFIYRDDKQ